MAVSKAKKAEIYDALVAELKEAKSVGFTQNSGITVAESMTLRRALREANSKYIIAKKTLIKRAMNEVFNVEINDSEFNGAIGVVISKEDAIEGLGVANKFVKEFGEEKLAWACGYIDWELKSTEDTKAIAGLPSRDTLLSRLVGSMMSPLSSFARFADAAAKEVESQGKENLSQIEKKEEAASE